MFTGQTVLQLVDHDHCYAEDHVHHVRFDHGHYCLHGNNTLEKQTGGSSLLAIDEAMQPGAQASEKHTTADTGPIDCSNLTEINGTQITQSDALHNSQLQGESQEGSENITMAEIESHFPHVVNLQTSNCMPPLMRQSYGTENVHNIMKENLIQNDDTLAPNPMQSGTMPRGHCEQTIGIQTKTAHGANSDVHKDVLPLSPVLQTQDLGRRPQIWNEKEREEDTSKTKKKQQGETRCELQDGDRSQVNTKFLCIPVYVPVPYLPVYNQFPFDPFPVVQPPPPQIGWGPAVAPLGSDFSIENHGSFDMGSCDNFSVENHEPLVLYM